MNLQQTLCNFLQRAPKLQKLSIFTGHDTERGGPQCVAEMLKAAKFLRRFSLHQQYSESFSYIRSVLSRMRQDGILPNLQHLELTIPGGHCIPLVDDGNALRNFIKERTALETVTVNIGPGRRDLEHCFPIEYRIATMEELFGQKVCSRLRKLKKDKGFKLITTLPPPKPEYDGW
jgi:hypothetical protein